MTKIKIAYYRKEDWKRLLEIIDDSDTMHDTWDEWFKVFLNLKYKLKSQGLEVLNIEIDLDELIEYCRMGGIKNNGKARSQFVQTK